MPLYVSDGVNLAEIKKMFVSSLEDATPSVKEFKKVFLSNGLSLDEILGGFEIPAFTGQHAIFGDEIQGRIEMYSSGTLTLTEFPYDVFLAGGGGSGGDGRYNVDSKDRETCRSGSGGGGGYTKLFLKKLLDGELPVMVGAASASTTLGEEAALYGQNGTIASNGGDGGSGGGGGEYAQGDSASSAGGGSDGRDGAQPSGGMPGGIGQGTTTRGFEEATNVLYSGGGGSGGAASGGAGGGGKGGGASNQGPSIAGTINSGGGGGGGYGNYNCNNAGAIGGSGIAIIRWGY